MIVPLHRPTKRKNRAPPYNVLHHNTNRYTSLSYRKGFSLHSVKWHESHSITLIGWFCKTCQLHDIWHQRPSTDKSFVGCDQSSICCGIPFPTVIVASGNASGKPTHRGLKAAAILPFAPLSVILVCKIINIPDVKTSEYLCIWVNGWLAFAPTSRKSLLMGRCNSQDRCGKVDLFHLHLVWIICLRAFSQGSFSIGTLTPRSR